MGLFSGPLSQVGQFLDHVQARRLSPVAVERWDAGPQVVLRQETALELGSPAAGSLSMLLWDEGCNLHDDRITLVGPDFAEAEPRELPFGRVILVGVAPGQDDEQYGRYCQLRDNLTRTHLRGLMTRVLPSRHSVWCRLSGPALQGGLDASVMGSALLRAVKALPFVRAAEVLLITADSTHLERLRPAAEQARDIVEALVRMSEELDFDCDGCQYAEICDAVDELRRIHGGMR